jgi:hypothetical protein
MLQLSSRAARSKIQRSMPGDDEISIIHLEQIGKPEGGHGIQPGL